MSNTQDVDAIGVSVEEREFFDALAAKWKPLSPRIKRIHFRFGEDSDGFPAVWIVVTVPGDVHPPPKKIDELYRLSKTVRQDVLASGSPRWPFVRIETNE